MVEPLANTQIPLGEYSFEPLWLSSKLPSQAPSVDSAPSSWVQRMGWWVAAGNNLDLRAEFEFFFEAIFGIGEVTLSNNKITLRMNMKLRTTCSPPKNRNFTYSCTCPPSVYSLLK